MKLLKKLIKRVENELESTPDRVQFSNEIDQKKREIQEDDYVVSKQDISVVVCEAHPDAISAVRHFAITLNIQKICYLGFENDEIHPSLATSFHKIEEVKYYQVKSLIDFEKKIDHQMVVISSNSHRWLESLMYLRRSIEKVSVYIAGTQNHFLNEQKILSKYRENFSGAIMKKDKGKERRYSAQLLEKKLEGVPLIFLSDGVIKADKRELELSQAA